MYWIFRSSHTEMFLAKEVLKICSKFTGEHPCLSAISIKLFCNFIEITLRHGCSPVNLLHIFRTSFAKDISGRLLLDIYQVLMMYFFRAKSCFSTLFIYVRSFIRLLKYNIWTVLMKVFFKRGFIECSRKTCSGLFVFLYPFFLPKYQVPSNTKWKLNPTCELQIYGCVWR